MSRFLISVLLTVCAAGQFCFGQFDVQGHRGARGSYPENSLPGFLAAAAIGVNTLQMEVVISKDGKVVVSHDPWISPAICLDSDGKEFEQEDKYVIYDMPYRQIKKFDCGSKNNDRFPAQVKLETGKPTLKRVIRRVERKYRGGIHYNIELKSSEEDDGVLHPDPEEFSENVYKAVGRLPAARVIIQSSDPRILRMWRERYPEYRLAWIEGSEENWKESIERLGFQPDIYSPHFQLLSPSDIVAMQDAGMRVIPWTVNDNEDMRKFIEWGVNGIITDYPGKLLAILGEN